MSDRGADDFEEALRLISAVFRSGPWLSGWSKPCVNILSADQICSFIVISNRWTWAAMIASSRITYDAIVHSTKGGSNLLRI